MSNATMRAKLKIGYVYVDRNQEGETIGETLKFHGVSKPKYDPDGLDEDNTFAKFSPAADLSIRVLNPELFGEFAVGDTFYVDFTPAT